VNRADAPRPVTDHADHPADTTVQNADPDNAHLRLARPQPIPAGARFEDFAAPTRTFTTRSWS